MRAGAAWIPQGAIGALATHLARGDTVAIDTPSTRYEAWRVLEAESHNDGTYSLTVEQLGPNATTPAQRFRATFPRWPSRLIWLLPEHYPICSCCQQLIPCRQVQADQHYAALIAAAARFENPSMCPACGDPISKGQKTYTFDTNLYSPLTPTVVFHARQRCEDAAIRYDRAVARREGRQPTMSCSGTLVRHVAQPSICSNPVCPGSHVTHRSFDAVCLLTSACADCSALDRSP